MKRFALQILCCLSIGLGLHAATSPATITDYQGGYYYVMTNSKGTNVYHFDLSSNAGVTPKKYTPKLVELENTTTSGALKYLKTQNKKLP